MELLKTLEPVLEQPAHVWIDMDKVKDFARDYNPQKQDHWLSISPFDLSQLKESEKIGFLYALNSISFSYWGNPKWRVQYNEEEYDGAQAMIACLGRAIERGVSFNPTQLANFQREDLEEILRGNIEISLLDKRLKNIREVGAVTQREYGGDFRYILSRSQQDALKLVDLLIGNFPSFEDSAVYRGSKVEFSKRAQLLACDVGIVIGGLAGKDWLTACADYKLPQVLRRYGILKYSNELQRRIRAREEIPAGSGEEIEIRAHTIHAVELIKGEVAGVTSSQINDYLWLEGQVKLSTDEPYHLTRTTAY